MNRYVGGGGGKTSTMVVVDGTESMTTKLEDGPSRFDDARTIVLNMIKNKVSAAADDDDDDVDVVGGDDDGGDDDDNEGDCV